MVEEEEEAEEEEERVVVEKEVVKLEEEVVEEVGHHATLLGTKITMSCSFCSWSRPGISTSTFSRLAYR